MNTTYVEIRTDSDHFIDTIKDDGVRIHKQGDLYVTVIPVYVEARFVDLVCNAAMKNEATAEVDILYQDPGGTNSRHYVLKFVDGVQTEEDGKKMKFIVSYWPEQNTDPAFWVGYTATIWANSIEEAEQEMNEQYGDCNPTLSPANKPAHDECVTKKVNSSLARLERFMDEIIM